MPQVHLGDRMAAKPLLGTPRWLMGLGAESSHPKASRQLDAMGAAPIDCVIRAPTRYTWREPARPVSAVLKRLHHACSYSRHTSVLVCTNTDY
jgi:hypothetical protein